MRREIFFFFTKKVFLNCVISVLIRLKFKSTSVRFVTESSLQGTLLKWQNGTQYNKSVNSIKWIYEIHFEKEIWLDSNIVLMFLLQAE